MPGPDDPWGVKGARPPPAADPWAVRAAPVAEKRSTFRRFVDNIPEGFQRSGMGHLLREVNPGFGDEAEDDAYRTGRHHTQTDNIVTTAIKALTGQETNFHPFRNDEMTPAQTQELGRRQAFEARAQADPVAKAKHPIAAGAAAFGGQLVGGLPSPENLYGGPGKSLIGRAAVGSAIGSTADAGLQGLDISQGLQEEYSPLQTVVAGATGAAGSVVVDGATAAVKRVLSSMRGGRVSPEAIADIPPQDLAAAAAADPRVAAVLEASGIGPDNPNRGAFAAAAERKLAREGPGATTPGVIELPEGWGVTRQYAADQPGSQSSTRTRASELPQLADDLAIPPRPIPSAVADGEGARSVASALGRTPVREGPSAFFQSAPIADGYDVHRFEFEAPNGTKVAGVITPPKAPGGALEIDLNGFGEQVPPGANSIGAAGIRKLYDEVRAAYPNAGSITGLRTTGANPGVRALPVRPVTSTRGATPPTFGSLPKVDGTRLDQSDILAATRQGGGLREAPRPGAVPSTDAVGRAAYPGMRVGEIQDGLRTLLGSTVRQGRMTLKGRAIGEYHGDTGVVRTKAGPEINVVTHEIGHDLEARKLPTLSATMKAHATELKGLAYPDAAKNALRQEGFAEFFRWYVTNPTHARAVAPNFYDAFEGSLSADRPEVLGGLKELQGAYKDYLAAPSSGVVSANVVTQKPRTTATRYAEAYRQDGSKSVGLAADEAFTAAYDRFHPVNVSLRTLKNIAAANGRPIGDLKTSKNPYRLARMASGSYASGHMNIMQGVRPKGALDPEGPALRDALRTALGKSWTDDSFNDFGGYLMSRRMIHEWDRYEAGAMQRPPDMLSREAHGQAISDFEAANPKWRDAAEMVTEWSNQLWRKRLDHGFITPETYVRGLQEHPDYVPAQRDMSDLPSRPGGTGRNGKFAGGADQFKGSDRPFVNPIQSLMRESFELEAMIARNEVLTSLLDVADMAGNGSGAIIERIPAKELKPVQVDAIEAANAVAERMGLSERDREAMLANLQSHLGDDAQATVFQSVPITERGEPIVYAWKDGERVAVRLPDGEFGQQMFETLSGMDAPQKSMFLDAMAAVAHVQRFGITTNPAFTLRNFFRDQLSAWMLTDVGYKPFVSGVRGMVDEMSGSKLAKRYNAMGGLMGGANVSALPQARQLRPEALQSPWAVKARNVPAAVVGVTKFAEIAETGTRLGLFRNSFGKAKKAGLSDYDAAMEALFEARDYFDTDLHGSKMLAAKRILPFFNANLQGMRKAVNVATAEGKLNRVLAPLGKNAPQTPGEQAAFTKAYKLWAKMAALGVSGAALTALYLKDPEYREFDERERATHWMVKGPEGWLKLPKPFELAALSNIFERATERYYANDPKAWENMRKGLADILLPPVQTPAVTVPFEIGRNKDYAGRPIVPEHLRGKVDPVLQFNSYTSELGKALGRVTNTSPAVWDHAIAGFFGTWGRDAEALSNFTRNGQRPSMAREDVPVLTAFRTAPERGTASSSEFWDRMASTGGDFAEAEGSFRQLIRQADADGAMKYLKGLDAPARDYVLSQTFSEGGSGKLNPMERARLANSVLSDMRRDLSEGAPILGVDGQPIALTPDLRRNADNALSKLQMAELSNGLKGAGVKGWAEREYIPRKEALSKLADTSPDLRELLELRMAVEKVPPPAATAKAWPQIKSRLDRISDREMRVLIARERAQSPATRLDEALKMRGAVGR